MHLVYWAEQTAEQRQTYQYVMVHHIHPATIYTFSVFVPLLRLVRFCFFVFLCFKSHPCFKNPLSDLAASVALSRIERHFVINDGSMFQSIENLAPFGSLFVIHAINEYM